MKRAIFTILLCFVLNSIYAQQKEQTSGFFIVPSWNLSSAVYNKSNTGNKFGLGIGVEYLKLLNKKVFFTAMLGINGRGYGGSAKVRATYLDLPVGINLALGKTQYWVVGVGAYGGVLLSGKYKSYEWIKMKIGDGSDDNRSRTDGGFTVQFGVNSPSFGRGFMIFYSGQDNVIPTARQSGTNFIKLRSVAFHWSIPFSVFSKNKN